MFGSLKAPTGRTNGVNTILKPGTLALPGLTWKVIWLILQAWPEALKESNHEEEATKDLVQQQTRYVADEIECLVENISDANGGSKKACVEEPLPVSVMENRVDEIAPQAKEQFQDAAIGGASHKIITEKAVLESKQGCSDANGTLSKQGISKLLLHYGTKIMKEKTLSTSMEDQASAKVDIRNAG